MKILLVEDDREAAEYLTRALNESGHAVDCGNTGFDGLMLATGDEYDVVILDRLLPDIDGLTILKTIRAKGVMTPVLVLTAIGGIDDRVEGLNAGADDYLVKPFAFSELLARVRALGRRLPTQDLRSELTVGDLRIDLMSRAVSRAGEPINLQPREYQLLEYLVRQAGQIVTRTMLLEHVWGFNFDPRTNIIETHMSKIRAKLDNGSGAEIIHTVRGAGYIVRDPNGC